MDTKTQKAEKRFWNKVHQGPHCWEWLAGLDKNGYGKFRLDGRMRRAHQVAYELRVGPIPGGLDIDHTCRNRRCVNPAHLETVTRRVNILRGESFAARNAALTHCIRGHAFSAENTRTMHLPTHTKRVCLQCDCERHRQWRARKKGNAA